jgi:hypothetical protein
VLSAIMAAQSSRANATWENEREAREYINETWRYSRRSAPVVERGAKKLCGAHSVEHKKKVAKSQTESSQYSSMRRVHVKTGMLNKRALIGKC